MKVALLNQYYAPAEAPTARLLTDLACALAREGHEVTVLCSRRSYVDPAATYPTRQRMDGVDVRRIRSTGFGRSGRAGRLFDYLSFLISAGLRLVSMAKHDVVVSMTTPPMLTLVAVVAARLRGARCVNWVMDIYPDVAFELGVLRRGSLVGRLFARASEFTLRRADVVVALGETMAERLAASGARQVAVVHNWADGEAIRPRSIAEHPFRRDWGWEEKFVVLHSGNMGLAHEFDTVLGAAELLRDDDTVLFAFIGGGPRKAEVEAGVSRRGLSNVCFRPYVPSTELGQGLTSADVHLVTLRGRMPGLLVPSKLYGILAAGRPAIYVGPDDGEVPRILREGECGACVAEGDARGLADAVIDYKGKVEQRAEHGRRARRLFDERFSRDHGLRKLMRAIVNPGEGGDHET